MSSQPDDDGLKIILARFNDQAEPFEEMEIADAIQGLLQQRGKGTEPSFCELAEGIAFSVKETESDECSMWGTYYGPRNVWSLQTGEERVAPNIAQVTPSMLDYWRVRLEDIKRPRMRARYADLIYDFTDYVTGQKPDFRLAQIVIDETLKIVESGDFECVREVRVKLKRALRLTRRLNDQDRAARACEVIVAAEQKAANDKQIGTWGFAFDTLLQLKPRAELPNGLEATIIGDLEQRLQRVAERGSSSFDHFAVEAAALRLARYYRSKELPHDVRRVLQTYANAWVSIAEEAMPILGAAWLRQVHANLREFGLTEETATVEASLRALEIKAPENMVKTTHSVNISGEEMEQFLVEMTEGDLPGTLLRIVGRFLPDPDKVREDVLRTAREFPLSGLFTKSLTDQQGRVVAEIGSVEHDLDGHVVHRIAEDMRFWTLFLRAALERTVEKFVVTTASILEFLGESPAFADDQRGLLEKGVEYYLQSDYCAAIHVLAPQIESAARRIVHLTGGPLYDRGRHGGNKLKNLDKLLQSEQLTQGLAPGFTLYLRVLLTDQRGWNIRNIVSHGLLPANAFGTIIADRLMHALLLLGTVRVMEKEQGDD